MTRALNPISDGELERRWAAVRKMMAQENVDALVVQSQNDWLGGYVKWFTDIPATNGYPRTVIFYSDQPMTVVDMGPFDGSRALNGRDEVHRGVGDMLFAPSFLSIAATHDYDANLAAQALTKRGRTRIGLAGGGAMPFAFVARLRAALPAASFSDVTEPLDAIKAIKSPEEITFIRAAAAMQDAIFAKVIAEIRPGMRDADLTAIAQREGHRLGSEQGIFLGGSSRMGVRSPFQPRHLQGHELQKGDHLPLLIENNGPGGFYCEVARTIVLGKASNEILDGFAAAKEAQDHTLSLMKPGTACSDIAAAHDRYMIERGLPPELRLYAHGQGYDMVERPLIRRDETMVLAENMSIVVHPGYDTDSLFAVICDNYIIGKNGPAACLHKTEKKVFEVY